MQPSVRTAPIRRPDEQPDEQGARHRDHSGVQLTWRLGGRREVAAEGHRNVVAGERFDFSISPRTGAIEEQTVRPIGAIHAFDTYWSLSNLTSATTFVVENLEGGAELVKVAPRRLGAVVPFEISHVMIHSASGLVEIKVFAPPPGYLRGGRCHDIPEARRPQIDVRSKYFMVLVALCEPRLRRSSMAAVPSVQEVVERLRAAEGFADANRSSINFHIDYLRSNKLPVDEWAMSTWCGRRHSKREALVSFALRHDLVREEHLQLLPPSTATTALSHYP